MYKNNDEEPKEELVIPIYTKDINSLENDGDDCHYKTEERTFKFSELLAIATKGAYQSHHIKRGGALVFVRDRKDPYVTRDDYSVKKIIDTLNENPFACFSCLTQAGSPNIYVYNYGVKVKNNKLFFCCDFEVKNNNLILPNGAQLFLTKEAKRKLNWVNYVLTKGSKKSCFFENKKKIREKNHIQLKRKEM